MHLHIGYNMPGCLPEAEVACTNDWANAVDIMEEDMRHGMLDSDDEAVRAFLAALRTPGFPGAPGDVSLPMDDYNHWIEMMPGDWLECETGDAPDTAPFPRALQVQDERDRRLDDMRH